MSADHCKSAASSTRVSRRARNGNGACARRRVERSPITPTTSHGPRMPSRLPSAHHAKELLTRAGVVTDHAEQTAGGRRGSKRIYAAQRHATVLGLDHHTHTLRLENVLNRFGNLGGEFLLNLQPTGEPVHHPRQLGDAHH